VVGTTRPPDPIPEVIPRQQGRRWNDDRTQLHRGKGDLPQLNLVAEHDKDLHPSSDALSPEPSRDLVGPLGQFPKAVRLVGAIRLDDPQGSVVGALRRQHGIEPVNREVEALGSRPAELGVGGHIVRPMGEKKIPSGAELICGTTHRHTVTQPIDHAPRVHLAVHQQCRDASWPSVILHI
jgi:hypothetical protein